MPSKLPRSRRHNERRAALSPRSRAMKRKRIERVCVGYHPASGCPLDENGRAILIYDWVEREIAEEEPEPVKPGTRGVQGTLL